MYHSILRNIVYKEWMKPMGRFPWLCYVLWVPFSDVIYSAIYKKLNTSDGFNEQK